MNRLITLFGLALALTFSSVAQTPAFPFSYYVHDTTGAVADYPLPSPYQFPMTLLGSSSHVLVIKAINTSTTPAFMGGVFVAPSTTSTTQDPNFTVTGLAASTAVGVGGSLLFQVNFSPTVTGTISSYLQTNYAVQESGCSFTSTSVATRCPGGIYVSGTLTGIAYEPQLVLSYQSSTGSTALQPSATPLDFGSVSVSSTKTITFTLYNQSALPINVPSITVPVPAGYSSNPFTLDTSNVPATLSGAASANFTITFTPGQTGAVTTSLVVGSNTYPIQGAGFAIANINALQVSYVDGTGVTGLAQAATPINFGQLIAGTSGSNALVFTVTNPTTSNNSVSVSAVTVSGTAFTISAITGASTFPVSLAPGASLGFTITFAAATSGTYTGSLSIGTLVFSLSGLTTSAQTPAFPFTYYIHDSTGAVADYPLPSPYQFAATAQGSSSHIVVKAINTSTAPAFMGSVFVSSTAFSTVQNPNFTITGLATSTAVPVGGSLLFQVNFSPTVTGPLSAYLQTSYEVQSGCTSVPSNACPSGLNLSATLTGTATPPQLVLSYQSSTGSTALQPSATPLNFGNVSVSATETITFTLSNQSTLPVNVPSITVPPPTTNSSNAFALDTSNVPATLAAGASANFTITFAPGQTGVVVTSLIVGANTFPIQGAGVVIADIDALQISYVDSSGVRTLPQAATPISFDQLVAGTSGTSALVFTVTNPTTSYNNVTVSALTVSGTAFTVSAITGASSFPVSLAPGASLGFTITFTAPTSGTYTGSLAIGTRVFSLSGLTVKSPLPSLSLSVSPSPLTSQQQATVTVQLASASALAFTGTISLTFAPTVIGVTNDPAVLFIGNGTRTLPISVASGAVSATYNNQSAISFQTGTTAGTITFTVSFPNTPAYSQSFSITPAVAQITSATAVQSSPNLVITINGYDNTYSAGELNFTFYDTSGNAYPAIAYSASGSFQNLFFGSGNTTGGAFVLQATFPVTGDITKVGSVLVGLTNSVGQATTTQKITQ